MSELMGELMEAFPPRPLSPEILAEPTGTWDTYIRNTAFEAGCRGLSWDKLHPAFMEVHYDALRWMGLDSFAAFLPAYLASLLRGDTQNMLPGMVLTQLARREDFEERFDARVAHLTATQRATVLHVLEALARSDRFDYLRDDIMAAIASWRAVQDLPDPAPAPEPADAVTPSDPAPTATEPARSTVGRMPSGSGVNPAMADLLDAIHQAFPPKPFPPDLLDDPKGHWEEGYLRAREFEAGVQGHSWNTLIPELVEIHNCALSYLRADAFAAVVPAFLALLVRGDALDVERILASLTRRERWFDEPTDAWAARLTEAQRAVIVRVLEALAGVEDMAEYRPHIDEALARWRVPPSTP